MEESLGPLLTRVRLARGWSQLRVAELLCAASSSPTVTRNEVSRWEREERIPSVFWLGWLALVFDMTVDDLNVAAGRARRRRPADRGSATGRTPPPGQTTANNGPEKIAATGCNG
jgi:transcriptional regulator with XRE-family HTH domain